MGHNIHFDERSGEMAFYSAYHMQHSCFFSLPQCNTQA